MEQYLYCRQCGREFTHWNANKSYCDECAEERKKNSIKKYVKKNQVKKKAKKSRQSLNEIMIEIAEYNKEHGTSLSYGQYVSMNR